MNRQTISTSEPEESAPEKAEEIPHRKERFTGKNTRTNICIDCEKACGGPDGCSWSKSFTPVPGWDAELVYIRPNSKELTYAIRACPLFEETPPRPWASKGILDDIENEKFEKDPIGYLDHRGEVNLEKLAKKYAATTGRLRDEEHKKSKDTNRVDRGKRYAY